MLKIIDNLITNSYSQHLFDQMVQLPWTFVPNLSLGASDHYRYVGFSHNFWLSDGPPLNPVATKQIKSDHYNLVIPLLLTALDRFGLDAGINNIFRCRARLTLNRETSSQEQLHRDFEFDHLVLLYYVNSTDGDTVIHLPDGSIESITPRRGRCVLFDGNLLHASSSSTASPRIVLNTNLVI